MPGDNNIKEVPFAALAEARREMQQEIAAVNWLLEHLAELLPPDSPTGKAISRQAPWRELLLLARWEGNEEIAAVLEEALENLGSELPPEVRR
ncbi:MAG: hypothetical protein IH614_12230 [Desulfuromonadales bacterium]|nr:hypothetical protein [Desulfuromonadales bacterium]